VLHHCGDAARDNPPPSRRHTDSDDIAALVAGEALSEAAALAGGVERAREFLRLLGRVSTPPSWMACVVGMRDGEVCAVLEQGPAEDDIKVSLGLILGVVKAWGLGPATRLLPRGLALQRVRIKAPAGSWLVREVHVRAEVRGRGLGTLLLRPAEEDATRHGRRTLALTTRTNNPARALYERLGYQTIATRTNKRYLRYSGAEGRVLMVKKLD
jgi:ribosomal protein S18 acetylase RimI-like enzyme